MAATMAQHERHGRRGSDERRQAQKPVDTDKRGESLRRSDAERRDHQRRDHERRHDG